MVILSDDGNSLSGYTGNFSKPLPSVRFTPQQLEIIGFIAQSQGGAVEAKTTRGDVTLPDGADAGAALKSLQSAMGKMSLTPDAWQWSLSRRDGRIVVSIRPQNLVSANPPLLEVMREHEGVYADNSG